MYSGNTITCKNGQRFPWLSGLLDWSSCWADCMLEAYCRQLNPHEALVRNAKFEDSHR